MRFSPKDEMELSNLIEDGIYNYIVQKSEEKPSKSTPGNTYIALTLKIWDKNGRERLVFTNLSLMKLLKHFCDVNNLEDNYKKGEILPEECMNKSGGMVHIGIELEKPNGNGGFYPAKNIVKDYVKNDTSGMKPLPKAANDFVDSDLPF